MCQVSIQSWTMHPQSSASNCWIKLIKVWWECSLKHFSGSCGHVGWLNWLEHHSFHSQKPLPYTENTRNNHSLFFLLLWSVFITRESTKHLHTHSLSSPPSLEPRPPRGSTEPRQEAAGGVWGQLPSLVHQRVRRSCSAEPDGACAHCQCHLAPRVWGIPPASGGAPQAVASSGSTHTEWGEDVDMTVSTGEGAQREGKIR